MLDFSPYMPCVYILKNQITGTYYIGSTIDLTRRLKQHLAGQTPTTKRSHAINLVFSKEYNTLREAREIERRIKKWKRKDFIDKIVREQEIRIRPLSSVG